MPAFPDRATLLRRLDALPPAPAELGVVRSLVVRLDGGRRLLPPGVRLDLVEGVVGDRWSRSPHPHPEAQVTAMRDDVARVFTEGREPSALGDNLFVDLDLAEVNLPVGSLLRVGEALCEVTAKPHRGCTKFAARVGEDAFGLTRETALAARRLRGLHLAVREAGDVRLGAPIRVLSRGPVAR